MPETTIADVGQLLFDTALTMTQSSIRILVVLGAGLAALRLLRFAVQRLEIVLIKKAFDAHGIEIPFPHRSRYMGDVSKPFEILLKQAPSQA